ncbi:hypothetical protein E8E15_001792 [Penicillium rubens]|nr:hypothetical protein E8E15_001792 [Penicillium rubens]
MLANQTLTRARLLGRHRWPKAYLCRPITNNLKPLRQFDVRIYCLDRLGNPQPEAPFSQNQHSSFDDSLHYSKVDVVDAQDVDKAISSIAGHHGRLDGLVAAAGITRTKAALKHSQEDLEAVINVNLYGAFNSATATARRMLKFKTPGSIILVASMSGLIANKGIFSPVYNASRAAVIQLRRNLAQEWEPVDAEGRGGIRVNNLSPGHIYTSMAKKAMQDNPRAKEVWEEGNMLGRISEPQEFRGAALFLMSDASSYMTGAPLLLMADGLE